MIVNLGHFLWDIAKFQHLEVITFESFPKILLKWRRWLLMILKTSCSWLLVCLHHILLTMEVLVCYSCFCRFISWSTWPNHSRASLSLCPLAWTCQASNAYRFYTVYIQRSYHSSREPTPLIFCCLYTVCHIWAPLWRTSTEAAWNQKVNLASGRPTRGNST